MSEHVAPVCGIIVWGKTIIILEPDAKGGGWLIVNWYDVIAEFVVFPWRIVTTEEEAVIKGKIPVVNSSIK